MYCFSKCCRLCLIKNNTLVNIKWCGSDGIPFLDKLGLIAPSLVANPRYYKIWICEQCRKKLDKAYSFVQHCLKSDEVFDEYCKLLTSTDTAQNNYTASDISNIHLTENITIPRSVKEKCPEDLPVIADDQYYFESAVTVTKNEISPTDFKIKLESPELIQEADLNVGSASVEEIMVSECNEAYNIQIDQIPGTSGTNLIKESIPVSVKEEFFEDLSAVHDDTEYYLENMTIGVTPSDIEFIKVESSELGQEAGVNVNDALNDQIMVSEYGHEQVYKVQIDQNDEAAGTSACSDVLKLGIINSRSPPKKRCFKCAICNKIFARSSGLKRHKLVHTGEKPFKCQICNEKFTQSNSLKIHERLHTGARPYECEICLMKFRRSDTLNHHKKSHTDDSCFKCKICNKIFTHCGNLRRHEREHSGGRPYVCEICNETFSNSIHLKEHEKVHNGGRLFECNMCYKKFIYSCNLKRHETIHCGERPRPFKCEICSKSFTRSGHLRDHERIHSGERPFECKICFMSFTHSGHLKTHERVHSGDRPYECKMCRKTFTHSSSLKYHETVHKGEYPYECKVCNRTFTNFSNLKRHEAVHDDHS